MKNIVFIVGYALTVPLLLFFAGSLFALDFANRQWVGAIALAFIGVVIVGQEEEKQASAAIRLAAEKSKTRQQRSERVN